MKFIASALLLCLFAAAGVAQNKADNPPKPAQSIAELRQQLEKILQDTHTPGMSVAIVHRDGPEWVAGLGKADVAANRATTDETLFRIGSTSKAFASLSILKLVNEGKLSLQDPVHKLAPEVWFQNRWEATDPVRVVDLLEHTTGWDDMHLREYAKDAPGMSLRDGLDYDHHSRISRWRPGTRMAYCNSGPPVAAFIVEKITGQRFEDYVAQNFFAPIGMKTATYFEQPSQQMTTLYFADGKKPYPYWNILLRPAGAINASAKDMAAYVGFYLNRGSVGGIQVIPAASIDRMETPTRTWAAQQGLKAGYGLSNYITVQDGFVYHGHNGGVNGGLTDMSYIPEYGVGYFYSINSGNGAAFGKLGEAIRAYITRGLAKPAVPAAGALPRPAHEYARLAAQPAFCISGAAGGDHADSLQGRQDAAVGPGPYRQRLYSRGRRAIPLHPQERPARADCDGCAGGPAYRRAVCAGGRRDVHAEAHAHMDGHLRGRAGAVVPAGGGFHPAVRALLDHRRTVQKAPPPGRARDAALAAACRAEPAGILWRLRCRGQRRNCPVGQSDHLFGWTLPDHLVVCRGLAGQRGCLVDGAETGDTALGPLAFDRGDHGAADHRGVPGLVGRDRHPHLELE
jgi:CubicO group peptidase (beta-lactamase class C family)